MGCRQRGQGGRIEMIKELTCEMCAALPDWLQQSDNTRDAVRL